MFTVKSTVTKGEFEVYSIKDDNIDGVKFLIYRNNEWKWVNAYLYTPLEDTPKIEVEVEKEERGEIKLSQTYWISKDKSRHEFKDMKTQHLLNAIKLLRREVPNCKGSPLYNGLSEEYFNR